MTLDDFKDLLGRWGRYCSRKDSSHLGLAMSSYAERVGKDSRDRDYIIPADPDVLRFDDWINTPGAIEPELRWPLVLKYAVNGPDKTKLDGLSRDAYYARLDLARSIVHRKWLEQIGMTETAGQD